MAYPVFINDVVDGLIDLVFGINDKHSLFYLFPKHPVTELSLAHMIQKANPQISVDFIRREEEKEAIQISPNGKYLLDAKYPIAKKIRNIDIKRIARDEDNGNSKEIPSNARHFPIFIVWVLIFLALSPFVFTLFFSFLGLNTLYFAKTQIDRGNFSNIKSYLHLSSTFFYIGKQTSNILYSQAKIIGRENNLKRLLEDIDLGHSISELSLQAFNSGAYFSKIFTGKSQNPTGDFAKGESFLKSSIISLEKIKAEGLPAGRQGKMPDAVLQELEIINPFIKILSNTSGVLPGIFGMEGPRTYLILFQDNMMLRPTGGFIGSYGVLKVNLGKIMQFTIHDVYDADGQLRGHVEPPFAIRRHLPSTHWYMRDSNFDVDFVKAASASSNFLYIETGEKANGVIGVDVTFVKNILHAIGPVYIADYKETVDENNLYILTQTHSEKNFLRSLYGAIMAKISKDNVPYLSIAQAISDSLMRKHLILAFNNNTQNIFTVNGWSSSLWDERRQDEKSVNDFLGINEANLGINKVNYFISRKATHKVTIGPDGSISEELSINYKNASTSWPGGDYKNYLRIILPKNTTISGVSINDAPQSVVDAVTDPLIYEDKNFRAPLGLEVEKTTESEKTIYGFLINIPVGELIKIKIQYTVPRQKTFASNNFSYSLKLFKQPGVDTLPYSLSLYYPDSLNVIKISDGFKKGDGVVSYLENVLQDKEIVASFARK